MIRKFNVLLLGTINVKVSVDEEDLLPGESYSEAAEVMALENWRSGEIEFDVEEIQDL